MLEVDEERLKSPSRAVGYSLSASVLPLVLSSNSGTPSSTRGSRCDCCEGEILLCGEDCPDPLGLPFSLLSSLIIPGESGEAGFGVCEPIELLALYVAAALEARTGNAVAREGDMLFSLQTLEWPGLEAVESV